MASRTKEPMRAKWKPSIGLGGGLNAGTVGHVVDGLVDDSVLVVWG